MNNQFKYMRRSITITFVVCAVLLFPSCQEEKPKDPDDKHAHEHKEKGKHDKNQGNQHDHAEKEHDDKGQLDHGDKESENHEDESDDDHEHGDGEGEHSENEEPSGHKNEHDDHAGDDHGHAEGGHDDHGEGGEFGPNKGVEQYDEKRGIVLGALATKRFKVAVTPVSKLTKRGNNWIIPSSALIEEENDKGLYIKKGDWYQFIKIQVVTKSRYFVEVRARLKGAESIVSTSAALVRLAELNASGASGEGHGH